MTGVVIAAIVWLLLGRFVRRAERAQFDFRRRRGDDDRADLLDRELPPKPSFVAQTVARLACSDCGDLTPMNELEDVENGRLCSACFGKSAKTATTYRD